MPSTPAVLGQNASWRARK